MRTSVNISSSILTPLYKEKIPWKRFSGVIKFSCEREKKLEDGMEEIQDLVFAESKSMEGAKEAGETKESGEAKASELVKNLIANLVSGNGGEEGISDYKSGGLTEDGGKEENQKEGGIINHFIANLVSPRMSPTAEEADERKSGNGTDLERKSEDHGTFKSEEEFEGGGGGIINNLISNIFHHDQGGQREERGKKEEKAEDVEEGEQGKTEAGGGRSGLVEELISTLPKPLAENAAPATDEASLLIHSIVHD